MVAVMVFSGLTRAISALASADARAAMLVLDLCMGNLRRQKVKAHRARSGALAADPMPDGLLGVFRHQGLELGLGPLVVEKGLPGFSEQPREFAPGIRCAHIDDADGLDARPGRLGIDQM